MRRRRSPRYNYNVDITGAQSAAEWNSGFLLHQYPDPGPCFSVADPDPYVFGPPGSESIYHHAKIVRITLMYCFVTFFDFLFLKNDVKVP